MKTLTMTVLSLFFSTAALIPVSADTNVHSFTLDSITGESVDLSQYKGKVILIVNTASRCGFTRQYAGLVELNEKYADNDFVILGFPANNFRNQEPGTDEEILEFCQNEFGVEFPMFSRISVAGDDQHPLFTYLTTADNESFTGGIRWNFEKFLIDQEGNLRHRFRSTTRPTGGAMIRAIDSLLESS